MFATILSDFTQCPVLPDFTLTHGVRGQIVTARQHHAFISDNSR